jgi:hypothetical protein
VAKEGQHKLEKMNMCGRKKGTKREQKKIKKGER